MESRPPKREHDDAFGDEHVEGSFISSYSAGRVEGPDTKQQQSSAVKTEAAASPLPSRLSSPTMSAASDNDPSTSLTSTELPSAPSTAVPGPPPKKTKLTFAERELKRINKEIKDREKAEEKEKKEAEKEAQKKAKEAEKVEKEKQREQKEQEQEVKRLAREADKAAKDAEKRRKEEEKKKKDKSQMKLGNFFAIPQKPRAGSVDSPGRPSKSPAPQHASPSGPPSKLGPEPYSKLFPPFFIQKGVAFAPKRFERDEPATQYLERQIDGFLSGISTLHLYDFDPVSIFNSDMIPRGKNVRPVREIMDEFYSGKSSRPIDLTTDSQVWGSQTIKTLLATYTLKFLKFQEDVRPPYKGTYTSQPLTSLARLARNPLRRDNPNTDYDFDSEAEWIEDEDGEELNSDEEEEVDEDEDMDGFLDDENDETPHKKAVILGDLEPVSTGLCWEDKKKRSPNVKTMRYRMEIIIDPHLKSINPFSTSYWPSASHNMDPPRVPLHAKKSNSLNFIATPALVSAAVKPVSSSPTTAAASAQPSPLSLLMPTSNQKSTTDKKKLLPPEDLAAFRSEVQGSDLSKVGLVEVLKKKFPGHSGAAIKATLELVATRGLPGVKEKEKEKRWHLVDV